MNSVVSRLLRLLSGFVITANAILIFAHWHSVPPRDSESWQHIGHGMTKDEVLQIMGKPDRTYVSGGSLNWLYDFGGVDYFGVVFDKDNEVEWASF